MRILNNSTNMRRKTIFPIDWVKFHPYKQAKDVDTYYANLANRVFNVIYGSEISYFFDDDKETIADIAIRLTMYLEDLVSETGIWKAALAEFKKRYGTPLPFYELDDDYVEGFVNKDEVRFLLWNELQTFDGGETFINPENQGITSVALDIFYLLDEAWETAPENERLHDFLHSEAAAHSYWEARKIVEWFSMYSYVYPGAEDDFIDIMLETKREDDTQETVDLRAYSIKVYNAFCDKHNLLSITPPQWMARIRKPEEREMWENFKWRHVSMLRFDDETENQLVCKDLIHDEEFAIEKDSINADFLRKKLKKGDLMYCALVTYQGKWYQCGQLACLGLDEKLQDFIDEQRHKQENIDYQSTLYPKFKEVSGGRDIIFAGSQEELKDVYTRMGFKGMDDFKVDFEENCMVMCSPINGLVLVPDEAACICVDYNPFYDKAYAKENAHQFYFNDKLIDYREACDLHDHNLLPDAQNASLKGDDYANRFLHKNGSYIIDYCFRKNREYDYDAKFELAQFNPME